MLISSVLVSFLCSLLEYLLLLSSSLFVRLLEDPGRKSRESNKRSAADPSVSSLTLFSLNMYFIIHYVFSSSTPFIPPLATLLHPSSSESIIFYLSAASSSLPPRSNLPALNHISYHSPLCALSLSDPLSRPVSTGV